MTGPITKDRVVSCVFCRSFFVKGRSCPVGFGVCAEQGHGVPVGAVFPRVCGSFERSSTNVDERLAWHQRLTT